MSLAEGLMLPLDWVCLIVGDERLTNASNGSELATRSFSSVLGKIRDAILSTVTRPAASGHVEFVPPSTAAACTRGRCPYARSAT
jgi:hypothetical protein